MSLFAWPRCPVCSAGVSLRELWEAAPRSRYGILIGSIGITCPSCSARLRVDQAITKLVAVLITFGPAFGFVIWNEHWKPSHELRGVVGIPTIFAIVSLLFLLPRRFAQLRVVRPNEQVQYPLEDIHKSNAAS
jgi:hypothetical protein